MSFLFSSLANLCSLICSFAMMHLKQELWFVCFSYLALNVFFSVWELIISFWSGNN